MSADAPHSSTPQVEAAYRLEDFQQGVRWLGDGGLGGGALCDGVLGRCRLGSGASLELGRHLGDLGCRRILLVVDEPALAAAGEWGTRWLDQLAGCQVLRFGGFQSNPQLADLVEILRQLAACWSRGEAVDGVVALGGGTAIDLAKLVATLGSSWAVTGGRTPGGVSDEGSRPVDESLVRSWLVGQQPPPARRLPLVVLPTTAGTGSEATHFAVAYVDGLKHSVSEPTMRPDLSLVDPQLTRGMPPGLAAASGLDALCQAIESWWAVGATDASCLEARGACTLAWRYLCSAVESSGDESRLAMCLAAHLAGRAIDVSKTTAAHALSYKLTSRYGVSHGLAVAIHLPPLLRYNWDVSAADCCDARGPQHVRTRIEQVVHCLGAATAEEAAERFSGLLERVGAPTRLRDVGVTSAPQRRELVESVNAERLGNNPRRLNAAELLKLLEEVA